MKPPAATCKHMNFETVARVGRLTETEGAPVTSYTLDLRVHCTECGLPFRFIGLEAGHHPRSPRVNVDATELRAPIEPAHVTEILGMPIFSGRA